jgi:uncharacterized protein YtpQ (UPF0354 family)
MKLFRWRGRTSKSAFRDRVCTALRENLPGAIIEATGDLDVHISGLANGKSLDVWLGRAYNEFCKKPAEAEEVIARYVRGALATVTDLPVELDRIIPTVKSRDWLTSQSANYSNQKGPSGFEPWVEPYNTELIIVYAEYRDGIRYLHRSDFEALGISDKAIRDRALANVRRMIEKITVTGKNGSYLLGAGGTVDASLMLLDEVVDDPRLHISGKILIAVSDRGSFWVADDANPWAVFNVAAGVAQCYRSEQYAISMHLYHRSAATWEPLDPSPLDDAHPIPNLQVIDIHAVKKGGGSDLVVVVASPLQADARSIFRLMRKLDGYLQEINSDGYRNDCGAPSPGATSIIVRLHPRSDPAVEEVLAAAVSWAEARNASLRVEKIMPVAIT